MPCSIYIQTYGGASDKPVYRRRNISIECSTNFVEVLVLHFENSAVQLIELLPDSLLVRGGRRCTIFCDKLGELNRLPL